MQKNKIIGITLIITALLLFASCVDQHEKPADAAAGSDAANAATDSEAKGGADLSGSSIPKRIIATSMATVDIMDRLGVDLIGVPHSDLSEPPERYKGVPEIGMPMAPDIEKLKDAKPDIVFSPNSLEADLGPKYEAAALSSYFLDLRSVDGMYKSIDEIGAMLGREKEAAALRDEYESFLAAYAKESENDGPKRVLVLMGLPGSYIVATENSYVGSLVKLAGGVNVYEGEAEEFIAANTEDMAKRDPDVILRAAHALPDQVKEMFAEEFKTNDIWKHFRAVKGGAVYDLDPTLFGMSAKFNYPDALRELSGMLQGESAA